MASFISTGLQFMDALSIFQLLTVFALIGLLLLLAAREFGLTKRGDGLSAFGSFFYATFIKPHAVDHATKGQQSALESFYRTQADVYDASRKVLLRGREDMLALVAAQLKHRAAIEGKYNHKPVWIDIGGGTGYNIEAMRAYVDVPNFFSKIYLVDLSPSLLRVAEQRFARLGWEVEILCQDARTFQLPTADGELVSRGADLVTMSYSLSMIPDYYCVVDSIPAMLAPNGIIGVVDFYVQSIVEINGRNYTGGSLNRHVAWLSRVFWRAWFDIDRVGLEGARRDYLEYRFGTLKSVDERNYLLGGIPYYIFLGTQRDLWSSNHAVPGQTFIESIDASCTESPYLSPMRQRTDMYEVVEKSVPLELRSKAYHCAVINLSTNLPLPSMFYQNTHRRIYYDDQSWKHKQFNNEYIYAFTWEDPRVDHRLLKICDDDVVLCLTSAGDNVLDYILHANPRRIHAVDLNPSQNHLLELKVAALQTLPYAQVWKMFGEGRLSGFRNVLLDQLSPQLSSQACQFWIQHAHVFSSSGGLYETGGTRHAIKLVKWLFWALGLKKLVRELCDARTFKDQRKIWPKIRRVLLSRPLHWAIISTEWFAWKAAGVPPAQRRMILADHADQGDLNPRGEAIWEYVVNTLDPAVQNTLIGDDNYFYFLCLQGKYSQRCHPEYLSARAHVKLSQPKTFDGLRIHTDEVLEVITRLASDTVNHAIIMDSMDWFDPCGDEAQVQIRALNRVLKMNGKVLLRSAGLKPWYIPIYERTGFAANRVGARMPGTCIDRVNMYASTWLCIKVQDVAMEEN